MHGTAAPSGVGNDQAIAQRREQPIPGNIASACTLAEQGSAPDGAIEAKDELLSDLTLADTVVFNAKRDHGNRTLCTCAPMRCGIHANSRSAHDLFTVRHASSGILLDTAPHGWRRSPRADDAYTTSSLLPFSGKPSPYRR